MNRNGAFAEYLVIPSSNVWPCNPNIPEEMYAIFDPFGNATHTALSYEVLGEDVLITGAGPIGIMAAAIAKLQEQDTLLSQILTSIVWILQRNWEQQEQ